MPACPVKYRDHPNRLQAIARGLDRFNPGEKCNRGHTTPRFVKNGVCVTCNAENGYRQRHGKDAKPRRSSKAAKAANIAAVARRREHVAELPRAAQRHLTAYEHSLQSRKNSLHLDSLLKRI
jgi:hypothetical protein